MTRFLTAAFVLTASTALAVGFNNDSPPKETETSTQCPDGYVYVADRHVCVKSTEQSLNDDARYDAARELAYHGRPEAALMVLASAENPEDPRILNYKGFASRKLGQMDAAMAYYGRALEIDPDYILARSYMGMGLAEMGDLDGAKAQLVEIRNRGGRDTWAYTALKQTLSGTSTY